MHHQALNQKSQSKETENPGKPPQLWAYLAGTFGAQLANNALQVTLPLLLLQVSSSLSTVGFITALTTAVDTAGTLLGGWLSVYLHPRTLLIASTAARSVTLALVPIFWIAEALTFSLATSIYLVDSLARGVADTSRNTMPLVLVERNKNTLDWLNSRYQTVFELGAVAGPFLVGGLLIGFGAVAANWLIPAAFAGATVIYFLIPKKAPSVTGDEEAASNSTLRGSLNIITSNPELRLAFIATVLLTLYPLRGVLPALFADSMLKAPEQTAWMVGLFGLGAVTGSVLYSRLHQAITSPTWLRWSAAGVLLLAMGWIPGAFSPMALAIFLFALLNVTARLSVVSTLHSKIPQGADGGVMGLTRFSVNMTSMALRFLVGVAFAVAVSPGHGFALTAAGLAVFAVLQIWISRRMASATSLASTTGSADPGRRPSTAHRMAGRLIVMEGLDGSGKSTQMAMLRSYLEAQGLKVIVTAWNDSPLVLQTIQKAKKAKELNPNNFSLPHAANLTDRLHKAIVSNRLHNNVVLSALQEGAIVLSDRYFYTSLGRDAVRGLDHQWLRSLYASVIRPDLVLYFKSLVETAISRVLRRSETSLRLSEDFDEQAEPQADGLKIKYLEAGLDLQLSDDPIENFRLFQTRVAAEYDAMVDEFGFLVIEADRGREEQHAKVIAQVTQYLGSLSSFVRSQRAPEILNLFDKDPYNDPPRIHRNYLHGVRGIHLYFRNMLLPMQERFAQLLDHSKMPKVFLHGSPHIDNYSKSAQGAAMVDFDRSRFGPYAWDIVRLLTSISLRRKNPAVEFLDRSVLQQFTKGYLRGFRHPAFGYEQMSKLKDVVPGGSESTTDAYLKANRSWAQEMRATRLPPDYTDMTDLLRKYLESRDELTLLDEYHVEEAGRGFGSMGRNRFIIVLAPNNPQSGNDRIFLEIKRVREDPDTHWYQNPFDHHGKRMIAAAELYAPGWEQRQGFATYRGLQYWGHEIPTQNVKLKEMLSLEEQRDFAYAVGTQLGRGHRLSLQDAPPKTLESHLKEHFEEIVRAGQTIKQEIACAYARYLKKMIEQGLEFDAPKTEYPPPVSQRLWLDFSEGTHVSSASPA